MKIYFNQTLQINNTVPIKKQNNPADTKEASTSFQPQGLTLAHFPNVNFKGGMNPHMRFLLEQTPKLKCAYSGFDMISLYEARTINMKLAKKPNAMSAINYLEQYACYMHDVESIIFDIFKDASHKGKRGFQDILLENKDEALEKLKITQFEVLNKPNKIIENMSPEIRYQVETIRNDALAKMDNSQFTRKGPLELIKRVKATGEDLKRVIKVYQTWYKLPSSSKDINAFIVQYAKQPHENISRRLISSAIGTVEHVQPSFRNGKDGIDNYLLVSAQFNNERDTMPLDEYIMLNSEIDIRRNLQAYIDNVIKQVNNPKSPFSKYCSYPDGIKEAIDKETSGSVILNTDALRLTKEQIRMKEYPQKLSQRFIVNK